MAMIGIVADSHSNLQSVARAAALLRRRKITTLLHCGDIADPPVIEALAEFNAYFVFGNVDRNRAALREAIAKAGGTCCEEFGELELAGRRIALLHGDDHRRLRDATEVGVYDLVCYGHTHQAESHRIGPTLVVNPGALHRARPRTFAVYDPRAHEVQIHPL